MALDASQSTAIIDMPIYEVFQFVTNPYRAHYVLPGLLENFHIPELPIKPGDYFHYTFTIFGVKVKGITRVTKVEAPHIYEGVTEGGVETTWRFELEPAGEAKTRLTYTVSVQSHPTMLGSIKQAMIKRMNHKLARQYVQGIKRILEFEKGLA